MTSPACYEPMLIDLIPTEAIADIYYKLEEENSLHNLFIENDCPTVLDFIALVQSPLNNFYAVLDKASKDLVAIFWVNGKTAISMTIHTAFFKQYFGKAVEVSKQVLPWVFKTYGEIETLLCIVPVTNRIATSFVKRVGWNKVGRIPNFMDAFKQDKIVDGMVYYISKDEV